MRSRTVVFKRMATVLTASLLFICILGTSLGAAQYRLTFWNMPFVTQEVSPDYVLLWQNDAKTALPDYVIDDYYGPGKYKDQRDRFLLQARTGIPDVIEGLIEDMAVYVNNGIIEPLDSYFAEWADGDQFVESTLEPLKIDGKLYGIPYNTNARALIYRKDVLEQYGLSVPKTWDELIETARAITEKSNKQIFGFFVCTEIGDPRATQEFITWYFQVSDRNNPFIVSTVDGERVVEVTATVDQLEKVLDLYKQLYEGPFPACDPNLRGTGWPTEDPGYVAGKFAMAPMGPWLWGRRAEGATAKDILENRSALTRIPYPKDGVPATYLEVKPIMMNAFSKNKTAAWDLIKYITSKEKMAQWLVDSGGIPARVDSLQMEIFDEAGIRWWIDGFAAELPIAVAMAPINWGPVNEANLRAVNYVIYNQMAPREAAEWLINEYHELNRHGTL